MKSILQPTAGVILGFAASASLVGAASRDPVQPEIAQHTSVYILPGKYVIASPKGAGTELLICATAKGELKVRATPTACPNTPGVYRYVLWYGPPLLSNRFARAISIEPQFSAPDGVVPDRVVFVAMRGQER